MENHHQRHRRRRRRRRASSSSFFPFLAFLAFLAPAFSAYDPATNILLNCGASTDATYSSRTFVADSTDSDDYRFLGPTVNLTSPAVTTGSSQSSVYASARVSSSPYSYELTVNSTGTHFLRLHFSPFATTSTGIDYNLTNSSFGVSAHDVSTFTLLTNYSPAGKPAPIVKEYLLWASSERHINLTFTPTTTSIAFINAIEFFSAPKNFLPSKMTNFDGAFARENAMETVVHLNAGGAQISPVNDTLWRTWTGGEKYLENPRLARRVNTTERLNYLNNTVSGREFAPESVYSTAERMNVVDEYVGTRFNVTWNFSVPPDHMYLVRMHFCDFNLTPSSELYFDVYLNSMVATRDFRPGEYTNGTKFTPFFVDYLVDVGKAREVVVSVGPSSMMSPDEVNAFLNGVEIMKLNNSEGSFYKVSGPFVGIGRSSGDNNRKVVVIAVSAGGAALLAVIIGGLVFFLRERKKSGAGGSDRPSRGGEAAGSTGTDWTRINGNSAGNTRSTIAGTGSPRICLEISLEELESATKNFDGGLVLGSGGFGNVYYGELRDGTPVAAKRSTSASTQGNPEFQNEINVLSQIRHRHLVSLIGYCDESNQMILVYEYMNKGTLRSHLYDSEHRSNRGEGPSRVLSWKQRLKICIGSARGLHYLHTGYSPGIIHRDVKSSNILLATEEGTDLLLAKVSDFGLSKVGPEAGETHVSTTVKGSIGYLDPEYFKTQKLTEKSDVYSFGVVLFEVLCARPAIDPNAGREEVNLAEWAVGKQREGLLEEIVDEKLKGTVKLNSLTKFGETAEKCVSEDGWERPTMGDVLWNLEYALQLQEAETRREVGLDSVDSNAQISAPVRESMRRLVPTPSAVAAGGGAAGEENRSMAMDEGEVYSQLITGEGR